MTTRTPAEQIAYRDLAVLEVLYATGCRGQELCDMRFSHISWNDKTARVHGKGNKDRIVILTDRAIEAIKNVDDRWQDFDGEDRVFVTVTGRPMAIVNLRRIVHRAVRRGKLPSWTGLHTIRHSFATHMLEGGADVSEVSRLLGHESIATTGIYLHLSHKTLLRAHEKAHPRA
jgi:integrase/recombinase XerD